MVFLQIFTSHYGIPFLAFSISLLAKIQLLKHCFIIAFSVFLLCDFAVDLLFLLLLPLPFWLTFVSSLQFSPVVVVCCATPAVVCVTFASCLRLYLVFLCAVLVLFEVVCCVFVYFSPLLPLWCRVFPVLVVCVWCCLVLLCVGCLVCGWLLRVCGVAGVCLVCVVFVFCLLFGFWFVLLCPLFGGCCSLSAVLLLVVLWLLRCSVARVLFGSCVAPGCSWLVHASGCCSFGGRSSGVALSAVLCGFVSFCHDLGWSCSWFNAECHPGGWLCGVSAPCFSRLVGLSVVRFVRRLLQC